MKKKLLKISAKLNLICSREVGGEEGKEERTYSLAVGSITSKPHNCQFCHKQYASKVGISSIHILANVTK